MRKHFLQTLLVVVLSVIGVNQCWAAEKSYYPLSYVGLQSGVCGYNENNSISFNNLNNSITVGNYSGNENSGDGFDISGNFNAASKSCFHALFKYDCSVEPYTKVVLTYGYQLGCYTNKSYDVASLYKFDNENTAKTTYLDFTEDLTNGAGSTYRFDFVKNQALSGWKYTTGSTKFVFDNLTGTSKQSNSKYVMLVLVEGQGGQPTNGYYVAALKCTGSSLAYTYAKVITFDANGGSGSMSQQVIETSGNLTTNAFARFGYTFTGWNTKADGTGTAYTNGQAITATASDKGAIKLYAQWKENLFSYVETKRGYCAWDVSNVISFNNLNNSINAQDYSDATYGDGKEIYIDGQGIPKGTKTGFMALYKYTHSVEPYTKVVLTYSYTLSSYSVNWQQVVALYKFDDENTAKTTSVDFTHNFSYPEYGSAYRVDYVKYEGYQTTLYWFQKSGSTNFEFDNLAGTSEQSISKFITVVLCEGQINSDSYYTAHRATLKCTGYDFAYTYRKIITFDGNGFTGGSMYDQNIDDKGNLTTNAFTRTGYTFNGWNTQADGKGTAYANGAEITATESDKGPVTLYAQWKRTVTLDAQSGTVSPTSIEVNCYSTYSNLPTPTRTGYTFNGWFDAPTGGKQYTTTTASTNDIPETLYAQWTAITYNITYNVNGGSAITEHKTYTIETETFALPVPTRDGYTFGGWFTNEACTEGKTTEITQGSTENKTFYAKWNAIDYTITYHENGGSKITEPNTYTIETATFDLPVPTRDGYTFDGWFTNKDCTEGQTTQIVKGSTTGNKEFYAKWSENVVSDGTGKTLTEAQNEVNTALSTWVEECEGSKAINLTINRTIYKDGYYNTLCLPFDMSATQIAATFGTYKELKQFQSATVQGTLPNRSIVIEVEDATTIEAGKAYLISFENNGEDLTSLTFNQVIVSTTEATNESGTLAYQGILAPYQLPYEDQDYLFLGANNTLYWAINDGTFMKGFRAYFKVDTNSAHAPYRAGMPAAFGGRQTPTDLSPVVSGQEVRKLVEQGRVVIVNKGVKYNMNGATVQ